jgi:glycerol-3-phosphate dehydrogenase
MTYDYDLVVIGAGIHGAGVAQAAAAEGYSVLVLEQYNEAAQGTSSKSSKLIHGGLRYLESAQFSLVYECLRERSRVL